MRNCELRLIEAVPGPSGEVTWVEVRPPRRGLIVAVLAVVGVLLVAAALAGGHPWSQHAVTKLVPVTVERGDTLWRLAARHCGPGEYLPKAVYEIRRANALRTSRLMPGQKLVIPVQVPVDEAAPTNIAQARGPQVGALR